MYESDFCAFQSPSSGPYCPDANRTIPKCEKKIGSASETTKAIAKNSLTEKAKIVTPASARLTSSKFFRTNAQVKNPPRPKIAIRSAMTPSVSFKLNSVIVMLCDAELALGEEAQGFSIVRCHKGP